MWPSSLPGHPQNALPPTREAQISGLLGHPCHPKGTTNRTMTRLKPTNRSSLGPKACKTSDHMAIMASRHHCPSHGPPAQAQHSTAGRQAARQPGKQTARQPGSQAARQLIFFKGPTAGRHRLPQGATGCITLWPSSLPGHPQNALPPAREAQIAQSGLLRHPYHPKGTTNQAMARLKPLNRSSLGPQGLQNK